MPSNVEIKAALHDRAAVVKRLAALATEGPTTLAQHDTFFACPNGRLKLRELGPGDGQLIFYTRADAAGPKISQYRIAPIAEPGALRATLAPALGVTGEVKKVRTLYLVGRTRVHLDEVEGLGNFLELEVVLRNGEAAQAGVAEAHALLQALGIPHSALVSGSYADLLAGRRLAAGSPPSAPA